MFTKVHLYIFKHIVLLVIPFPCVTSDLWAKVFAASLPQNGTEEAERHSVAGKEAEKAESMPQNEAQGFESHSVAMLAVAPATLARNLAG